MVNRSNRKSRWPQGVALTVQYSGEKSTIGFLHFDIPHELDTNSEDSDVTATLATNRQTKLT